MRTALGSMVYVALGMAAVLGAAPASIARDSRSLEPCKPAGTGMAAEERRPDQVPGTRTGISVDVPIGKICVNPDSVDGEPTYVRQTIVKEGMRVVELSTTPFMPVLTPGAPASIVRTDQPAGW